MWDWHVTLATRFGWMDWQTNLCHPEFLRHLMAYMDAQNTTKPSKFKARQEQKQRDPVAYLREKQQRRRQRSR